MSKKDIFNEIRAKNLPVIISGAGVVGEVLLTLCQNEGINVECFCDNSEKVAQSKFCGLEVIYAPFLKNKYKDAVILISVVAIKDVVDLLNSLRFFNWYAGGLLLKDLDIFQNQPDASLDYAKFAIENCILCHEGYLNPDKLFFRSIDLIITERCSLRCKDCSNLMQYYEKPKDCDTEMLLKSIDSFCAVIDEVMDFRIIGGETFINREWPIIFKRLINEPKAKRVVLYTNGTIIPNEQYIPCLQNNKVLIIITDYGILSRNLGALKQMLEKNKITHYVLTAPEWLDCSAITPHNRSIDQKKEIFKICCAKNMATLSDGKLFRCPYAANAHRLSAVPDNQSDYIDLFQKVAKEQVRNYILNKDYMEICEYCNGRPLSGKEVQSAVQINKPVVYHKYIEER